MAQRKAGDKKLTEKKNRTASGKVANVQADNYSIAFEQVQVGGNVGGDIRIGHTIGYTAEQVSLLLKQITTTLQPKPFDGRCPYKGLEVFEEEDAELFFGRERLVNELVGRVKESRTVFITGPSGSGKSSLVRAGLIHALKRGGIKGSDRWLYETMKPGREPLKDLALAFSRLKSPELQDYFLARSSEADILNKCAESVLSGRKEQRFLLFVDQFEEVFTQINSEEERVAFINMLAHAGTVENGRVIVLFAMRSDFVSNCATYPSLNELLSQEFRQIGAMQPEELVNAIALPALHVGLPVEHELIAQIINDMRGEPDALPLMQFALKDLFDAKQTEGGVVALTLKDYLGHGGIHKSLERHADATFAKLSESEQELTRSIFSGLIEIGRGTQDTKRTALFDELIPASAKSEDVLAIVQKLADARLIITDEQAGRDTVTISHEKLIEAWPWLQRLVNENRDVIALQNEIASDAKEWEEHGRDASYLYTGARLANAREQLEDKKLVLSSAAHEFVQIGIEGTNREQERKKRLQRQIIAGLIGFTVTILVLLIFVLIQLNSSRSLQLASQAQVAFLQQNYDIAGLYAYQSSQLLPNDTATWVLGRLPYENYPRANGLVGHTYWVTNVAWSVDGRLASASDDATIIIWDLDTGQHGQILRGHTDSVSSLAWSVDGRLASASDDATIIIWDLDTGQPSITLKGDEYGHGVRNIAWSDDGRLASASADDTIIIWDLDTGQPAQLLKGHTDWVYSVAWSDDGRLASASRDGTIILWDLNTARPVQTLIGHTNSVNSVAWSVDGRLASASADHTIIIWDTKTGQPAQTLRVHTDSVSSVAWSDDGRLASASDDATIIIWDLDTGQPAHILKGHTHSVTSVAWSADGRLASASFDDTVILWDLSPVQPAQTLKGHTDWVNSVAWSDDGRLASGSEDNTIIIWDLKMGQPAQTLKGHTDSVSNVAWSTDGRLASASADHTIIIWDLKTGAPAQILREQYAHTISWSVGGRLASDDLDGTIIIWDLNTGKPAQTLKGNSYSVNSVAWSADGRLASGSWDYTVIVWDLSTGQPAQTLRGHTHWVESVAWSADGRLASGSQDGNVILWDLKTGQPAQILKGHTWPVDSVAWSADGRLASTSSIGGTIIIWDLDTGQPAQTLSGYGANSIVWSANGHLASGSDDSIVEIARADLIRGKPCNWIYRNLTVGEWLNYLGPLYVYKAMCPNLPTPNLNLTINEILNYIISGDTHGLKVALIAWKSRVILLGIALVLLAVLAGTILILRKLFLHIRHKTKQ